jgi:intracellular septation protein
MLWASLAIIVVFGGATLVLQDETFIKWKPTVLYWLFGMALAGGQLAGKNLIRLMLRGQIELPGIAWTRLAWSWIGFFVVMGGLNLYVAFVFSESFCSGVIEEKQRDCLNNVWVNFKLYGGIGLMLLFVLGQAAFLARYVQEDKP